MHAELLLTLVLTFGTTFANLKKNEPCVTPNKENAKCIPFSACTVIVKEASTGNPKAVEFARDSQCGFDEGPLVCCGSTGLPQNYMFDVSSLFTEKPPKQSASQIILNSFEIKELSDKSICGLQFSNYYIKGGEVTNFDEFPWMAAIEYKSALHNTTKGIQCGGSLINEKYVLTAAHCIIDLEVVPIRVWLGASNISTDANGNTPNCLNLTGLVQCEDSIQKFNIKKQIPHELYNRSTGYNDIGLLLLEKKVVFNNYIRPVCLPSPYLPNPTTGTRMTVAGWGITLDSDNSEQESDVKLKVQVPLRPNSFCSENLRYKTITAIQLCAGGESGKDACKGDSGGPLMRYHTDPVSKQKQWYTEGIVSYGSECGQEGHATIYTRVSRFIKWMIDTVRKDEKV